MKLIDSYEGFCKSFNGNPDEVKQAELLLFIRNWIIRISDRIDEESTSYSLDSLLLSNADKTYLRDTKKDVISRLVDDSRDAVRRIHENMRENIIRENVKLPAHKVREVNSYGLNWLSRRPGSTIKEKISNSNASMMAVQRRMSYDTGENRLYMAYLKELSDFLQTKMEHFPDMQLSRDEETFCSQIISILRNPDLDEIGRWENMPPNNTLLSDQNYKKIWKCWNELMQIDEMIQQDHDCIAGRVCVMLYVEFLTKANRYFMFPQIPVSVDYKTFEIMPCASFFFGTDVTGKLMKIKHESNAIHIKYGDNIVDIQFDDSTIQVFVNGVKDLETNINPSGFNKYIDIILLKLGVKSKSAAADVNSLAVVEKYKSVAMDLFQVRPLYVGDGKELKTLAGRLMGQTQRVVIDDEKRRFDIACDKSKAIILNECMETYTIATAVEDASHLNMSKLMHLLERYVTAPKLTFLFPDIYNEFQISLVHKAARLVFHEVRSFPRSVGVAFSYLLTKSYEQSFVNNDFILVVDMVDSDVSFTLIQGIYDDDVEAAMPEYKGIIWERHPSFSYSLEELISEEINDTLLAHGCKEPECVYALLGLKGIKNENGKLAMLFEEDHAFVISAELIEKLELVRFNISDRVNEFITRHKSIIGKGKLHIISLSEQLVYKGNCDYLYRSYEDALKGFQLYESLQKMSKITLWRDHLPELAIKLLYGRFNLVEHETITPEFNVKKKIGIDNIFTLSKDMKEYHFELLQNDVNRKTRYAAVVKHPAFPISHDVRCRLDMTYQYGAEEPYKLLFIPIDQDSGFLEAKVSWEKVTKYPSKGLIYPEPVLPLKWEDMGHFNSRKGTADLVDEMRGRFDDIARGFQYIDVRGYHVNLRGIEGSRTFSIEYQYHGNPVNIIFRENYTDKSEKNINFDKLGLISFEMNESRNKMTRDRYEVDLSKTSVASYGVIWSNKGNGYACYPYLNVDGKSVKVAFFQSEFDSPDDFHPGIKKVSYEVVPYKEMYKAINIHDEDSWEPYVEKMTYYAINIRKGMKPGQHHYNGWAYFQMLSMLAGGNTFHDRECPIELKEAFENAKEKWLEMYRICDDGFVQMRIFNLMSLAASDLGDEYFDIANKYVDDYVDGIGKIPDYIGYALGDYTTERQKELFAKMIHLPDEKMVCILSKSIWGHKDFVKNIPIVATLQYFNAAIDYLLELCSKPQKSGKAKTMCLEYLLGAFRLREYEDDAIDLELSLNNRRVRKLYDVVQMMIDKKMEIRSFLKLDISEKGIYEDIPDILLAMLMYITGEKGTSDIRIAGLDLDDVEI